MADTDLSLDFSQKYDEGHDETSKVEEVGQKLENTLSIPAPAGKTKEVAMAASPNTKKSKRYDHITEEAEKLQRTVRLTRGV